MADLKKIKGLGDKDEKINAYKALLTSLVEKKNAGGLKEFVRQVADESAIVSRPVLKDFVTALKQLPEDAGETHKEVAEEALSVLGKQTGQYEEQLSDIRYNLSKVFIKKDEFIRAAQVLQEIPLETGQRVYPVDFKVKVFVTIARLYLEEEKSMEAERYINKAAPLVGQIKKERLIQKYKSAFVRNQDFNRKFAEAALSYYRLSQSFAEDERVDVLEAGVRCAVLAPAGPQRSRLLAMYYKDDKATELESYTVLEKMFTERILEPQEVKAFGDKLMDHQQRMGNSPKTILETAVIEHNLLAASKVYNNIAFDELGSLLGVEPEEAEKVAARMIAEDRMQGSINQTRRLLYFTSQAGSNTLNKWDQHIEHACSSVNNILEKMTRKYPDFIKTQQ